MRKLELKEVVGYLPYGLKMKASSPSRRLPDVVELKCDNIDKLMFLKRKPILHPLSDIYNIPEIMDEFSEVSLDTFECAFFGIIKAKNRFDFVNVTIMELMFKHHIDIYGLLDANLAIDIKNITP